MLSRPERRWRSASINLRVSSWLFSVPFSKVKSCTLAKVSAHHFSGNELLHYFDKTLTYDTCYSRYKEAAVPPALWLESSLNTFRESLLDLCQPNRMPAHPPLERSSPQHNSGHTNDNKSSAAQAASTKQILDNFNKLMTACVVLRIENFTLYRVTTSGKKQMPKEFISGKYVVSINISTQRIYIRIIFLPKHSIKFITNQTYTKRSNSNQNSTTQTEK